MASDTTQEDTPVQLTPPEPVPAVSLKQADGAVKLEPAEAADLNAENRGIRPRDHGSPRPFGSL